MDIDLLAKMVKEVVMDHESVTLPGVGSFVAELVPAAFTDRGYTILPPYRRLYFSPRQGDDTLLADFYQKANPEVSQADADRILAEFLSEMKEVLKQRKTLILPGLGRLRATRENHFFFVADEDLDIWPAGFGLQPISLKTHEETPQEVASAVASLASILEQNAAPEPEPEPEEIPGQAGHDEAPASEPTPVMPSEASASQTEGDGDTLGPSALGMTNNAEPEEMSGQAGHDEAPAPEPEPVMPSEASASQTEGDGDTLGPSDLGMTNNAAPEPTVEVEVEGEKKGWKMFWRVLLVVGIVVLAALLLLALVGRVAPQWLDRFLYAPDQLEILRNTY